MSLRGGFLDAAIIRKQLPEVPRSCLRNQNRRCNQVKTHQHEIRQSGASTLWHDPAGKNALWNNDAFRILKIWPPLVLTHRHTHIYLNPSLKWMFSKIALSENDKAFILRYADFLSSRVNLEAN